MTAALIGIDWGTTSFRAFLMDARGTILDRRSRPAGIMSAPEGGYDAVLDRELGPWLAGHPDLPILASGMIGSRQGWVEVPYLACPAGARELAANLHVHRSTRGRILRIVPGLRVDGRLPDVLRGEETELVGALAAAPDAATFVLPGTHSKWARTDRQAVVSFQTFMTGEVFAVLRKHSILGRIGPEDVADDAAFGLGARAGLAPSPSDGGLLHRLFSARTLPLLGGLPETGTAAYLSGLLIGSEIREALGSGTAPTARVVLVGDGDLVERYVKALTLAGVAVLRSAPDAAARGQFLLAQSAGLLE